MPACRLRLRLFIDSIWRGGYARAAAMPCYDDGGARCAAAARRRFSAFAALLCATLRYARDTLDIIVIILAPARLARQRALPRAMPPLIYAHTPIFTTACAQMALLRRCYYYLFTARVIIAASLAVTPRCAEARHH